MEKLTTKEKEFIESKISKIPSLLLDFDTILDREYFEDPYRQRDILIFFLDAVNDLIAPCHSLIYSERRSEFIYPSVLKSVEP
jgi:hypothetical protein